MPVRKEPSGRRSIAAEVEVPGTPEEVWAAIASGPGISSWFVPSTVEEHEGGRATADFGPDMTSVGRITRWDPPHRYVVETEEGPGTVASEWIVEARSGGTCIVRVVHSWFASSDEWDAQFEGHELGWQSFFRILRLYLTHFRGQHGAILQVMGTSDEAEPTAWQRLLDGLGLTGARRSEHRAAPAGAPSFAGVVESAPEHRELMLRLAQPAPGVAHLFAMPMGGQVLLPVRLYLFGDDAGDVVTREEGVWQRWLEERFMPAQA